MGVRSKAVLTVLLVGLIVGVFVLQPDDKGVFQGQILGKDDPANTETLLTPDLKAELDLIIPEDQKEDIIAQSTITNVGNGAIEGSTSFNYKLSLNDQEIFTNSDSYNEFAPGDSVSFSYPIPRTIYQYGCSGLIEFFVDSGENIDESNELNNKIAKEFSC